MRPLRDPQGSNFTNVKVFTCKKGFEHLVYTLCSCGSSYFYQDITFAGWKLPEMELIGRMKWWSEILINRYLTLYIYMLNFMNWVYIKKINVDKKH